MVRKCLVNYIGSLVGKLYWELGLDYGGGEKMLKS